MFVGMIRHLGHPFLLRWTFRRIVENYETESLDSMNAGLKKNDDRKGKEMTRFTGNWLKKRHRYVYSGKVIGTRIGVYWDRNRYFGGESHWKTAKIKIQTNIYFSGIQSLADCT